MDGAENLLSGLLSDPKMMETVSSFLSDPESMKTLSSLFSANDGAPSAVPSATDLSKIGELVGKMNGPPDDRCKLLLALKPFVAASRKERIDQSVKILKLMSLAHSLGGLGIV